MKQTSIEWLVDQLKKYDLSRDNILIVIPLFIWKERVEKAKEMEKEQIIDFTRKAVRKILDEDRQNPFNLEQYYNEMLSMTNLVELIFGTKNKMVQ
jgi:hypothetical protein